MRRRLFLILIIFTVILSGCNFNKKEESKAIIGVSIVPLNGLVKEIIGQDFELVTMIPAGYSPTNYEASPMDIKKLSGAKLLFKIGVPAENKMIHEISEFNDSVRIIDLSEKPGNTYGWRNFDNEKTVINEEEHEEHENHENHNHKHEGVDPHQWLSPKRVKLMVEEIKDEIDKEFGESDEFNQNYEELIDVIDSLDSELKDLSHKKGGGSFLIYHPSLGYLADDYGFNMIAIEKNGKEATAKTMTEIINECKEKGIKVVFYQAEMDSRQAEIIAKEIRGKAVKINPLEENYLKNISDIINVLKDNLK